MLCPKCKTPMVRIKITKYEILYKCRICGTPQLCRADNGKLIKELDGNN